jgi:hypothetical protein
MMNKSAEVLSNCGISNESLTKAERETGLLSALRSGSASLSETN